MREGFGILQEAVEFEGKTHRHMHTSTPRQMHVRTWLRWTQWTSEQAHMPTEWAHRSASTLEDTCTVTLSLCISALFTS